MNKYSLIDILTKEIEIEFREKLEPFRFSGIQIPMIQRDYAQGRDEEVEVRKRFLKAIFASLKNNEKLELDFVYGSVKKLDGKSFFIPLDGQQRLTTLFLLYWYIGNRELECAELLELRNALKGFTYATRTTSRKFCEKISEIKIGFQKKPSEEIKESAWFFDSFKKDPTVKAMLVMLDAIHLVYGEEQKNVFLNLSKLNFYILPLDGFDLSDELYIKMNARGKQLTDFENFKADLTNWLKDEKNRYSSEFHKKTENKGRAIPYYISFGAKIDNDWTNMFWSFTKLNKSSKDKLIDPYFLEFWNRYLLNAFITESSLTQDAIEKEALFLKLYGKEGNNDSFKYHDFDFYKYIFNQEGFIKRTELTFDRLFKNFKLIEEIIKPSWDKKSTWSLFSKEINQRQRVLFYAVIIYLELNSFEETKFRNWIRVVWNIIIDPNIRSIPAMVAGLRLIKQLAIVGSADIYKYLDNEIDSALKDRNLQLSEEKIKAVLINADSQWETSITEAESHTMFKGNIRFLLPDLANTDYKTFTELKDVAFKIFSTSDGSPGIPEDYLWLRATLSKTVDISLPINLADGRFSNWNYLINNQLLSGIREVILICASSVQGIKQTLKSIIDNYTLIKENIWVSNLVKWEGEDGKCLLNYSETLNVRKYKLYNENKEEVYLFNKTIWTEGNILISNSRNEIISEFLKSSNDISHSWEWGNIQNSFFRGWNVILHKRVKNLPFVYVFDRINIKVGILNIPEVYDSTKNLIFDKELTEKSWICRKSFNYSDVTKDGIPDLITTIESEIFDEQNRDSLINKICVQ